VLDRLASPAGRAERPMETSARGWPSCRPIQRGGDLRDVMAKFSVTRAARPPGIARLQAPRPGPGRWITWTAALNLNTRIRGPRGGHVMVGGGCPVATPPASGRFPTWQRRRGSTPGGRDLRPVDRSVKHSQTQPHNLLYSTNQLYYSVAYTTTEYLK
jgi:hypothetical protein